MPKQTAPFQEGDYTYYYRNTGLQNQYVLYRKDAVGKEEVFLDPNEFSEDGTTSLADSAFQKTAQLWPMQSLREVVIGGR